MSRAIEDVKADVKNVLFIVADQWRGDTLGCLGLPGVATPNIDALAADSVTFTQHFTQASPCGPARASMLTGTYMHNHRQIGNGTPLEEGWANVATQLKKNGYDPALIGYTDTPFDPAAHEEKNLPLSQRWICPGFRVIEPFLIADDFANWRAYLDQQGYRWSESETPLYRTLYRPADPDAVHHQGRNFAPSRFGAEHSDTHFLADAALRYLDTCETPWFLHFNCLRPHPPLFCPAPYHDWVDPADVALPTRPTSIEMIRAQHPFCRASIDQQNLKEYFGQYLAADTVSESLERRMRATYYGNCAEVDANVGRLVHWLKANGQYDETLIIFTSDHGDQLGDNWIYGRRGYFDGHFHVPLIVRDPRASADASRGKRVSRFTEAVDLMPTILAATGSAIPSQCDGASLAPLLEDVDASWSRQCAYWEFDFRDYPMRGLAKDLALQDSECHLAVVRDERFKYVHFPSLPPVLIDLSNDPFELRNVAAEARYAAPARDYAQALLDRRLRFERHARTRYSQVYGESMLDFAPDTVS